MAAKLDHIIDAIENFAPAIECAAIETERGRDWVRFCISPDAEDAGWDGDLRVRVRGGEIFMTLEHSGPLGQWIVANDARVFQRIVEILYAELS